MPPSFTLRRVRAQIFLVPLHKRKRVGPGKGNATNYKRSGSHGFQPVNRQVAGAAPSTTHHPQHCLPRLGHGCLARWFRLVPRLGLQLPDRNLAGQGFAFSGNPAWLGPDCALGKAGRLRGRVLTMGLALM